MTERIKKIIVRELGLRGVNVDLNPIERNPSDLSRAANAIAAVESGQSSVRKRPGLIAFSTTTTAGVVLGGIDLPLADGYSGTHVLYIGRGAT